MSRCWKPWNGDNDGSDSCRVIKAVTGRWIIERIGDGFDGIGAVLVQVETCLQPDRPTMAPPQMTDQAMAEKSLDDLMSLTI